MNVRPNRLKWTKEQLEEAVKINDNYSDVLRYLKLRTAGGNWKIVKKYISYYNLDISHFNSKRKSLEAISRFKLENRYLESEIFCVNSSISRGPLKRLFTKKVKYECTICANVGIHLDKPLVLQLDHINGIPDDNRLENLRWLCPNCHSQTNSFSGRNTKVVFCLTCRRPTSRKSQYCSKECWPYEEKPIVRIIDKNRISGKLKSIDPNLIKNRVFEVGFEKCGREFNVTGNAIKKFLKKHGIEVPRYYTQTVLY